MSKQPVVVIGSYVSPYVRKVLVCLHVKGIEYQIDPIVPFFGGERFGELSPVRRIPVLIDGDVTLPDSTVICEYLEDKYPTPSLYPKAPEARARARWLEEFADTRMGEVLVWRFFNEIVIRRAVWGEKTDQGVVKHALEHEIPAILDLVERECAESGALAAGRMGIAEIAVATFFRTAAFAGYSIDRSRWPRAAELVSGTLDDPGFVALRRFEETLIKTPIERQREALAEVGAPLTPTSLATDSPRRGILKT